MIKTRSERNAGFTLVEVMVALAIAGLSLAAVAASVSQMVDAGSAMRERTYGDDYVPHILIMSSGDVSPFELSLLRLNDRSSLTLTMSLAGELEIQNDDQDPF